MTVSSVHWGMERFSFPTVQVVFDDLFIGIGDVFDKSCTNGFGGGNEYDVPTKLVTMLIVLANTIKQRK